MKESFYDMPVAHIREVCQHCESRFNCLAAGRFQCVGISLFALSSKDIADINTHWNNFKDAIKKLQSQKSHRIYYMKVPGLESLIDVSLSTSSEVILCQPGQYLKPEDLDNLK